jgi:hypothetical protein
MHPVYCISKYNYLIMYDMNNRVDLKFESVCNRSMLLLFRISKTSNDCDKSFLCLLKVCHTQRPLDVWQKAVIPRHTFCRATVIAWLTIQIWIQQSTLSASHFPCANRVRNGTPYVSEDCLTFRYGYFAKFKVLFSPGVDEWMVLYSMAKYLSGCIPLVHD